MEEVKYKTREERLVDIANYLKSENRLHVLEEQLTMDKDWDIRGTIYCPICDKYMDSVYCGLIKCGCEK
jgi:hypothetical protein